jgi:hypothetical protein
MITLMNAAKGHLGVYGFLAALALTALSAGGEAIADQSVQVNGSIHVSAGTPADAVATVNGSIRVDDGAAVTSATTVNGSVDLGNHASATSLRTVNGALTLGGAAHVSGDATSVNGAFTLGAGAEILGSLSNVNGKITLNSAHVAGGIKTVNGGISITGASRVEGGILVRKPGDSMSTTVNIPRIVIGAGAAVQGELRFERPVHLFVSSKATIGKVTGTTPVPFSGDTAPND